MIAVTTILSMGVLIMCCSVLQSDGTTALITACKYYSSIDVVETLINKGADIHRRNKVSTRTINCMDIYGHSRFDDYVDDDVSISNTEVDVNGSIGGVVVIGVALVMIVICVVDILLMLYIVCMIEWQRCSIYGLCQ